MAFWEQLGRWLMSASDDVIGAVIATGVIVCVSWLVVPRREAARVRVHLLPREQLGGPSGVRIVSMVNNSSRSIFHPALTYTITNQGGGVVARNRPPVGEDGLRTVRLDPHQELIHPELVDRRDLLTLVELRFSDGPRRWRRTVHGRKGRNMFSSADLPRGRLVWENSPSRRLWGRLRSAWFRLRPRAMPTPMQQVDGADAAPGGSAP